MKGHTQIKFRIYLYWPSQSAQIYETSTMLSKKGAAIENCYQRQQDNRVSTNSYHQSSLAQSLASQLINVYPRSICDQRLLRALSHLSSLPLEAALALLLPLRSHSHRPLRNYRSTKSADHGLNTQVSERSLAP